MLSRLRTYWLCAGIGCGSLFPVFSLLLDGLVVNQLTRSLIDLVRGNPVHLIVMAAPLVLGLCFALIGHFHARQVYQMLRVRASERAQTRLANTDSLTGCGNRRRLMSDVSQMLKQGNDKGLFHLLLIDLNKFKAVNDTLGHNVGDQLLVNVAKRIKRIIPAEADLYRLGGDEFVIRMPAGTCDRDVERLSDVIISALTAPFDLGAHKIVIGACIGLAATDPADERPEQVLGKADLALYEAKRLSGNRWRHFEDEMADKAAALLRIEQDLRRALERNEFFLEFQPIFSTSDKLIRSVEALVRWRHPVLGIVPPGAFIKAAESCGLIVPIGEYVLREACRAASAWPAEVSVSVNVSVLQFKHPLFFEQVVSCLNETALSPQRLTLEITESMLIDDMDFVSQCFDRLRELGIRFALDDFGTGFASINHLRKLHLDYLKLDKSFLANLTDNSKELELLDSMVQLGRSLNLTTTMEGVEQPEQLDLVHAHGINQVQGFYLAYPMSNAQLRLLFKEYCWVEAQSSTAVTRTAR